MEATARKKIFGFIPREGRRNVSKLCEIRFPGKIPVLGRLINQSDNGFCVESPFGLEYGPVIISGDEFGIIVGRIRWRLGRKAG